MLKLKLDADLSWEGAGVDCEGCGLNYELECRFCPDDSKSVHIGESSATSSQEAKNI